jgi:hypothetical protein
MPKDLALELLKLTGTLIAAFIAFAAFAPKVIELYQTVASRTGRNEVQRRAFETQFGRTVRSVNVIIAALPICYGGLALASAVFLLYVLFVSVPCVGITCSLLWIPYLAGLLVTIAVLYLLIVVFAFLQLFRKSAKEALASAETGSGR